jgi:hypothetical protein
MVATVRGNDAASSSVVSPAGGLTCQSDEAQPSLRRFELLQIISAQALHLEPLRRAGPPSDLLAPPDPRCRLPMIRCGTQAEWRTPSTISGTTVAIYFRSELKMSGPNLASEVCPPEPNLVLINPAFKVPGLLG